MICIFVTFNNLVVGEMQVEKEKHVECCQCATQNETRRFTHCTGNQRSHLSEKVVGERRKTGLN